MFAAWCENENASETITDIIYLLPQNLGDFSLLVLCKIGPI